MRKAEKYLIALIGGIVYGIAIIWLTGDHNLGIATAGIISAIIVWSKD